MYNEVVKKKRYSTVFEVNNTMDDNRMTINTVSPNSIGIIAEYNPFHKGHEFHLRSLQEQYPNAFLIIMMSGAFVQRGEPALFDKFVRAQWALQNGAHVVIELPSFFALASAEEFADGAIQLVKGLDLDALSFGTEHTSVDELRAIAQYQQTDAIQQECKRLLKEGLFYGKALRQALITYNPQWAPILNKPNALLGIEYIKAMDINHMALPIIPIKRSSCHHQSTLHESLPSGTALRKKWITRPTLDEFDRALSPYFPSSMIESVKTLTQRGNFCHYERYHDSLLLQSRLISSSLLGTIRDVSEGLENSIKKYCTLNTWPDVLSHIKSKRYSSVRLQRMCANMLLHRTKASAMEIKESGPTYARILGLTKKGGAWIRSYKGSMPLITRWAPFYKKSTGITRALADGDILANDIQSFCMYGENMRSGKKDFTTSPIVMETE